MAAQHFPERDFRSMNVLIVLCALAICHPALAIPAEPHFFQQRVDHFSVDDRTFQQRYYINDTSFAGAGSPIFMIMGGEGGIEPSTGIFYPSIVLLAQKLRGIVVEPEHRFYGSSQPLQPYSTQSLQLLTSAQALADAAALLTSLRQQLKCSGLNGEPRCPAVAIGGSYPGFLAAMMRIRYPNVVDMAYAASAPLRFYSQAVDEFLYYSVVTASAERAVSGCSAAVRHVLATTLASAASKDEVISNLGLCEPVPLYLQQGSLDLLVEEINMIVMYTFASLNMQNYPPGPSTSLSGACRTFTASHGSSWETLASFLKGFSIDAASSGCYNISLQLPAGANATVSSGDWSGVGSGADGSSWDFETCSLLIERISTNNVTDMFLPRAFTLEWLITHCKSRFNIEPQPRQLADLWGFDQDRLPHVTSHIVFTNGLNDGWSAGGILGNISDTLLAFNAETGAHHSDLSHNWPSSTDTPDVVLLREQVASVITAWLEQLK